MSDRDTTATPPDRGFIAVVGQWSKSRDVGKIPLPYTHAVEISGGKPMVVSTFPTQANEQDPQDLEIRAGFDETDASGLEGAVGLVIPGGGDIDPDFYGQEPHPRTHSISRRRDVFEMTLLQEALERDMPVLAICHGMQLLNVYLGGDLDQHLADDVDRLDHDRDRPRAEAVHHARIERGGILCDVLGAGNVPVNSHHHQGIGHLADPLIEVGWAGDGVLEAVESDDHSWVVGVQWHPEAMAPVDRRQKRIFDAFVQATREYTSQRRVFAG